MSIFVGNNLIDKRMEDVTNMIGPEDSFWDNWGRGSDEDLENYYINQEVLNMEVIISRYDMTDEEIGFLKELIKK